MHIKKKNFPAYLGILLLYLKLFFIQPIFSFQGVGITLSLMLLFVVFFRIVFKLTILKINLFGKNKAASLFWIFIFISTISSFFLSPDIATGVVTVNLQLFFVYLVFIDFKTINISSLGVQKIIKALVNFAILNAILVFYTFFFGKISLIGEVSESGNITRAFGLMGDQVAWFLSFFSIYALYNGKRIQYLIFLVAILMCASLGATLVLIIATLIYYIKEKRASASLYIKAGFFSIIFIGVLLISPNIFDKIGLLQRVNQGDFADSNSQTTGHRFNAINTAIVNIGEKPLWGYQNYSLAMFNKYDHLLSDMEKGKLTYLTTPNNQILAIICDYGLIGFVFFIFFIFSLMKIVRPSAININNKLYSFKKSSYTWLVVFFICNQSATWFLPGSFLWILICIIVGICYKINKLYDYKK